MTSTVNELKQYLQTMVDGTENKEQIESIGKLNGLVDRMVDEYNHLQDEQKDLLKDYKELIKHTSFQPTEAPTQIEEPKDLTFGEFLDAYKKN